MNMLIMSAETFKHKMSTIFEWLMFPTVMVSKEGAEAMMTRILKRIKGNLVLPVLFTLSGIILECWAIFAEKNAGLTKSPKSKALFMGAALAISIFNLALILVNAYYTYKKSGAKISKLGYLKCKNATRAWCYYVDGEPYIPWWFYGNGDPYNVTQEVVPILTCLVQIGFLMHETIRLRAQNTSNNNCDCHDAMIYPLIFTAVEFTVVVLDYIGCRSVMKIYCSKYGYIYLKQKSKYGPKTLECPGCQLARRLGLSICLMPLEFFKFNQEEDRLTLDHDFSALVDAAVAAAAADGHPRNSQNDVRLTIDLELPAPAAAAGLDQLFEVPALAAAGGLPVIVSNSEIEEITSE